MREHFSCLPSSTVLSSVYLCLHNSTALSFGLLIVCCYHSGHVCSTVRHPLGGSGRLPPLRVLVVLVDAGQCGHMEDVSDTVLRLQGGTLQIGGTQLLGCVGALVKERQELLYVTI